MVTISARIGALFSASLFLLCCSQSLYGGTLTFNVAFRTDPLFLPEPSYFLDFQFTQGDSSEMGSNSASISNSSLLPNFVLTDGTVPGSGEERFSFTPGQPVTFSIQITDLVTSPTTPDVLSVYIFDPSYNYVSTTDLLFNSLIDFTESTDSAHPSLNVLTFDTVNKDFQTTVTAVPEPKMFFTCLFLLIPLLLGRQLKPLAGVKVVETRRSIIR